MRLYCLSGYSKCHVSAVGYCYNMWDLTGESLADVEDTVEDRRANFVDSLLTADHSSSAASDDVTACSPPEKFQKPRVEENENSTLAGSDSLVDSMFIHLSLSYLVLFVPIMSGSNVREFQIFYQLVQ